ncbi:sulfur carrier protein ThiS [Pseudonocardia aurantiaca]|uniref:Sulfur carrier protein ThiS n=1 Tax=Pseudonocardia aurantiaca TaxID=75290 RepID=A0ABW4FRM8_9PSEU
MQVWINGEQRELAEGARVADVLAVLGAPSTGVAVAVDGEVVPRAGWADSVLTDGSRVEVLTAVQGG